MLYQQGDLPSTPPQLPWAPQRQEIDVNKEFCPTFPSASSRPTLLPKKTLVPAQRALVKPEQVCNTPNHKQGTVNTERPQKTAPARTQLCAEKMSNLVLSTAWLLWGEGSARLRHLWCVSSPQELQTDFRSTFFVFFPLSCVVLVQLSQEPAEQLRVRAQYYNQNPTLCFVPWNIQSKFLPIYWHLLKFNILR